MPSPAAHAVRRRRELGPAAAAPPGGSLSGRLIPAGPAAAGCPVSTGSAGPPAISGTGWEWGWRGGVAIWRGAEPGGLRAAAAGGAESRHGCDMALRGGLGSAGEGWRSPLGARCGVLCLVLPGAAFPEVTRIAQEIPSI